MSQRTQNFLALGILSLTMLSQQSVAQIADNQRILSPARSALVNPAPSDRKFAEINKKHQLLIAVIDSGVDYNHPTLTENLHFELDAQGKPTRMGWDFSGSDAWPAPLIAQSADLDKTAPADVRANEVNLSNGIKEFLGLYPQFASQLNVDRHVVQELAGNLFHGTHVAGLMVYDEPRLGLMAYRALPLNIGYVAGRMTLIDSEDNIVAAMKKAIEDGARVINMSLGTSINKHDLDEKYYQKQLKVMAEIKKIAQANPKVAIVAAAGNQGTWIDDKSRLGLPCGIEAKNILCVGALGADGEIASFSNIVLPDYPFLMAPGDEILSLFPSQFCPIPGHIVRGLEQLSSIGANQKSSYFQSLAKYCGETGQLFSSTGTSMASPIAARMVAKALLAAPDLSGAEAIQKVLNDSVGATVGRLNVKKLRVEKPSWYPKTSVLPLAKTLALSLGFEPQMIDEPEFFEFYTK